MVCDVFNGPTSISYFCKSTDSISGDTFRYRPDAVLINTPTAFRTIFGPKGNVKKTEDYYRIWPRTTDHKSTWNVTDIPTHAQKRRVLNHAFSEKALRASEPFVHENVDRWLKLIDERRDNGNHVFNMATEMNHLVFDILGDLCFGKTFNMKEPGSKVQDVPEILAGFLTLMNPVRKLSCAEPYELKLTETRSASHRLPLGGSGFVLEA